MAVDRSRKARSARKRKRLDEGAFLLRHHEIGLLMADRFPTV